MLPIIQARNPHIHTAAAPRQRGGFYTGIFQGFISHLQQQALLWIQPGGFARGYAEKGGVKLIYIGKDSGGKSDAAARFGTVTVLQRVNRPAIIGNPGNALLAVFQ